jgi:hypothetical protein
MSKTNNQFPLGWDEAKVKKVINFYDNQTEDEAVAEDEAIEQTSEETIMQIPYSLVPTVRELIARHQST